MLGNLGFDQLCAMRPEGVQGARLVLAHKTGTGECNRCLPRLITARLGPNVACVPNVAFWHIADVRLAAPEGLLTSGLPTLGAEGQRQRR